MAARPEWSFLAGLALRDVADQYLYSGAKKWPRPMYTALPCCLTIVAVIIATAVYFATPQAPGRCSECGDVVDGTSMLCGDCRTEMRRVKGRLLAAERGASRYRRQQGEGGIENVGR